MRNPKPATEKPASQFESPEPAMEQTAAASEDRWIDHIDQLHNKIPQLKALANAMYCVAYLEGGSFRDYKKTSNEPAVVEELEPLSLLSQRLCDEVEAHPEALYRSGHA